AGGRPFPNGGGRTVTLPPAAVMAPSADFENAWACTVTFRDRSPRPRTFTSAPLWVSPFAWSDSGVTSSRPDASMTSRLMAWYSTRNGFLNPLSFGTRMCSGICPPSKFIGIVSRAPCPFVPRPAVLPRRPAVPRPTRMPRRFEPAAGFRSWSFIDSDLFHLHQVRHLRQLAADLRTIGQRVRLADPAQPERAQRAPLLRLGADPGPG